MDRAGIEYSGVRRGSRLAAMSSTTATSISWDGLTLDPRPFARFDEHGTLTCGKKPVRDTALYGSLRCAFARGLVNFFFFH